MNVQRLRIPRELAPILALSVGAWLLPASASADPRGARNLAVLDAVNLPSVPRISLPTPRVRLTGPTGFDAERVLAKEHIGHASGLAFAALGVILGGPGLVIATVGAIIAGVGAATSNPTVRDAGLVTLGVGGVPLIIGGVVCFAVAFTIN